MKITSIRVLIATLMVVMFMGQSTVAQDLDVLLNAVDKIESNLKNMIEQEKKERRQQFSELKSTISKSKMSANGQVTTGISEEQFVEIVNELSVLRAQVAELEKYFEKQGTQFASINNASSPAANRQVEELGARLEELSHDVHGLMEGQHQSTNAHPKKQHKSAAKHSSTTINGKLYSHGIVNISDNEDSHSEFALSRAYLTVRSKLSDHSAVRVTTDLKTIDEKYNIILKYAYFDWKPAFGKGIMGFRFGLQPTEYIDYMNKLWGRRYAAPTIGDLHHLLTSSDLGFSTTVGFGPKSKFGFVKLALLNGTSYSQIGELNSNKDFNIVTLLTPFKASHSFKNSSLLMQFYTGTQNEDLDDLMSTDTSVSPWDTTVTVVSASDWKRQIFSVGGAFVWDHTFDFGFDLNFATIGKGPEKSAYKKQALSFFGAYYFYRLTNSHFLKNLAIIGRVDKYDPNKNKADDGETLVVFGLESKPMYSLKMALNYRITSFQDDTEDTQSMLFLNTLFKF